MDGFSGVSPIPPGSDPDESQSDVASAPIEIKARSGVTSPAGAQNSGRYGASNKDTRPHSGNKNKETPAASNMPARQKKKPGNLQTVVVSRIEDICKELNLPLNKARRAAKILLGNQYVPNSHLPDVAKITWSKRHGKDLMLTPIQFMDKYWGKYIEEDILSQCDLRRLDNSLFEAVKIYCRNRQLNPLNYLPSPSRKQAARVSIDQHPEIPVDASQKERPKTGRAALAGSAPRGFQVRISIPG